MLGAYELAFHALSKAWLPQRTLGQWMALCLLGPFALLAMVGYILEILNVKIVLTDTTIEQTDILGRPYAQQELRDLRSVKSGIYHVTLTFQAGHTIQFSACIRGYRELLRRARAHLPKDNT